MGNDQIRQPRPRREARGQFMGYARTQTQYGDDGPVLTRIYAPAAPDEYDMTRNTDVLVVVTTDNAAVVNLPPIASMHPGRLLIIQNCDPALNGNAVTVQAQPGDLINEAAIVPIIVALNNGSTQLVPGNSYDPDSGGFIASWYTVCCAPEIIP